MSEVDVGALPKARIVFLQQRWTRKSRETWFAFLAGDEENDGRPLNQVKHEVKIYPVRKNTGRLIKSPGRPGAMYEIPFEQKDKTTTIYSSSSEYIGRWENKEDCVMWQAENDAIQSEHAAETRKNQEMRENLPAEALAPFRAAYNGLNWRQQQQLLAWVMWEITHG